MTQMTAVCLDSAEQLALAIRATREFAEATTDYGCLIEVVARRLAESFDASCELHCASDGAGELVLVASSPLAQNTPNTLAWHERSVALAVESATPLVCESEQDGARMLVPLRVHGKAIGILRLQRAAAFDAHAQQLAQLLADHAAIALGNATKMEAVGRLAGGIAHDFNNVLSAILGYADLIHHALPAGDPLRADVEELRRSGRRAADLTKQLLMFSRRRVLAPRVVDLRQVLSGMRGMLERVLGQDVALLCTSDVDLGQVEVDEAGIEQVVMNLVVNARDAMPHGGTLTIEARNVSVDAGLAREHLGMEPGPHVRVTVTDDGHGMDDATRARAFEPFFTTKAVGKGTGLGLAIVLGIVKQSGGQIWVDSQLGAGTRVELYLPRCDKPSEPSVIAPEPEPAAEARGHETILLVEDQDEVRRVAGHILRQSGYHVLPARDALEAQLLAASYHGRIHLLLSDVSMPRMNGPELAQQLLAARGELKVLCMSGYTDDNVLRSGVIGADLPFLQKPFTSRSLTNKVREVLDQ